MSHRQRPPQKRVNEPESRCACPDGQGQRQDRGSRRDATAPELPPSEDQVGAQRIEPPDHPYIVALLALPQRIPQRPSGFDGVPASRNRFFEVRLKFFIDVAVYAFSAKYIGDS
jgi:hypothetical protein